MIRKITFIIASMNFTIRNVFVQGNSGSECSQLNRPDKKVTEGLSEYFPIRLFWAIKV